MKLRTARLDDRPHLAGLAREAFPRTAKFGLAPRWMVQWYWDAVLGSEACEVWIAEEGERLAGFAVLVTDPDAWERERRERPGSLRVRVLLLAARPHVWPEALRARTRRAGPTAGKGGAGGGPRASFTWLDWFAVAGSARGSGVGRALFHQLEVRTRACGRGALRLDVFRGNRGAQAFFARQGCLVEGESRYVKKYVKPLAQEAASEGVPGGGSPA